MEYFELDRGEELVIGDGKDQGTVRNQGMNRHGKGDSVSIGLDFPRHVPIVRTELPRIPPKKDEGIRGRTVCEVYEVCEVGEVPRKLR